jgi:hypothetical protein
LELENQKVMFDMDKKEFMNYFNILSNFKAFIEGQPSHFKIQQKSDSLSSFPSTPPVPPSILKPTILEPAPINIPPHIPNPAPSSSLTPLPSKPIAPELIQPNLKELLHVGNFKLDPILPKTPKKLAPMSLEGVDLPLDQSIILTDIEKKPSPEVEVDKSLESLQDLDNAEIELKTKSEDALKSASYSDTEKTIKITSDKKPLKESDWDPW